MELIFDQGNESDALRAQNNKLFTFRCRPGKTTTYLPSTLDISLPRKINHTTAMTHPMILISTNKANLNNILLA